MNSIQSLMWRCAGIERDGEKLESARGKLAFWSRYVLPHPFPTPSGWEMQNVLTVSSLVTEAAYHREESRGVHYRLDFPERDDKHWRQRIRLRLDGKGGIELAHVPFADASELAETNHDKPAPDGSARREGHKETGGA